MQNKEIIKALDLTASLLELYGENQFKVRSYQTAVYNLERTNQQLDQLTREQLAELPGVGKSIAATIEEMNQTGSSSALNNLLKQTPSGILELVHVKGLGARKIKTAWDQLGVESADELLQAAQKGELAGLPGFGEKTQEKILQIISFHLSSRHLVHYKEAHNLGTFFEQQIKERFKNDLISRVGPFRRKMEVISNLQYLWATGEIPMAVEFLDHLPNLTADHKKSGPLRWVGDISDSSVKLDVRFCKPQEFGSKLVYYTGSTSHLLVANDQGKSIREILGQSYAQEEAVYSELGWPLVIPELREGLYEKAVIKNQAMESILKPEDIKGVLHNHSTYSDGKHSLSDMAKACKDMGYQYFGISDHSQTAVYANGLDEERVLQQHREIDLLNEELAPFRIFKGIESDILNNGSLDYPDIVLQSFDFVVASIHFNINMDSDQATKRLITAIENPYTTILGHPTGRQLLKREGYPIDHKKVIDACARNQVVIEINAHPWRLDLDWRWVGYAVENEVMISINPDAHSKQGLGDVYFGVCAARKSGLSREKTFNALGLKEMTNYLQERRSSLISTSEV